MTRSEEIAARLAAARSGPWTVDKHPGDKGSGMIRQQFWIMCPETDCSDCAVAQVTHKHVAVVRLGHCEEDAGPTAEMIAHAPADLAYLLARVGELEAGLREIAAQHPEHDGYFEDGCPCCIARATLWEPAARAEVGA